VLPPPQAALEADYRSVLARDYGVEFHHLLVLTNMPIQRFAASLRASGDYDPYLDRLRQHHDDANLSLVMCRSLISVDWRGRLHDCDFNQQLGLELEPARHLADLLDRDLEGAPIRVGEHCFGCTAGAGSSCGGALR
jgi:radical SAM/Cys-rich protein